MAVAVAVIYLPQALLADMQTDLRVPTATAGWIPAAVQVGYAVGIFLLVPLADRVHPSRQVTVQALLLAGALLLTAAMPGPMTVAAGFAAVGLVANIAQVIISASGSLAPPGKVPATVAVIVGSLGVGIFGGRIIAGLLVTSLGWRGVLVVFAVLVLSMVFPARAALRPATVPAPNARYGRLLLSALRSVRRSRVTAQSVIMQFFAFAAFNSVWAVVVLHLSGLGWSAGAAGLFGGVGLAAAPLSPAVYRRLERWGTSTIAGVFSLISLIALAAIAFTAGVTAAFAVAVFLVSAANQFIQTANQQRVLEDNAGHPAPANAMFMVGVFLGGATGSFLGITAFEFGGMPVVGALGAVLMLLSALVWALSRLPARSRRTS
ncbi:MFS transporter [Lentzea cavernae]|uniref:MFS transporter n=1 Tax=Lentzea cavernae TaxID=2020703 RepID=A0ABQ3M2U9_9PSEU|nr:MFS transporter [Lentzea cavernae]